MKHLFKSLLAKSGWLVRKYAGLKFGVVLERDVRILSAGKEIRTVFDVGANRGVSAAEFLRVFPECSVYAFEPSQEPYEKLAKFASIERRVSAFPTALGSEVGRATLLVNENAEMATLRASQQRGVTGVRQVEVDTIDNFLAKTGSLEGKSVDLLKIDTEGYEIEVLRGALASLKQGRIRMVYAECSMRPDDEEHTRFLDLSVFLRAVGFNFVALYDQCVWENAYSGYCNALFKHASA